ncbi:MULTISPECIES: L-idonate 5-dehydrogenase [unclassified Luteococcus]|uniref:L-idonate 5-dehydrogenase n=1 Tax=unclassified Luteococcus TaxID=2639923 RepID=UPI00313C1F1B
MKSVVIHSKLDVRTDEVPTPEPAEGQVRLRMAYAGICGSDLHYYFDGAVGAFVVKEPLCPGHEVSGTVDVDPSGRFAVGTPVTVHPATFGQCQSGLEGHPHLWPQGAYLGSASTWPHTQGGASEYLLVRSDQVRVLPEGLDLRTAALAEPLGVGLHAIAVAQGVAGKRVLVSGSGPIGLLAAAGALAKGAAEVVCSDVIDEALERATALGAHGVVNVARKAPPTEHFDAVLECSGVVPAINAAIGSLRRTGILVQVGMVPAGPQGIDLASIISRELQLRGTFRFNTEIDEAVELLAGHPTMAQVITHVLPADQAADAFAVARDSKASGKVLLDLWNGSLG